MSEESKGLTCHKISSISVSVVLQWLKRVYCLCLSLECCVWMFLCQWCLNWDNTGFGVGQEIQFWSKGSLGSHWRATLTRNGPSDLSQRLSLVLKVNSGPRTTGLWDIFAGVQDQSYEMGSVCSGILFFLFPLHRTMQYTVQMNLCCCFERGSLSPSSIHVFWRLP